MNNPEAQPKTEQVRSPEVIEWEQKAKELGNQMMEASATGNPDAIRAAGEAMAQHAEGKPTDKTEEIDIKNVDLEVTAEENIELPDASTTQIKEANFEARQDLRNNLEAQEKLMEVLGLDFNLIAEINDFDNQGTEWFEIARKASVDGRIPHHQTPHNLHIKAEALLDKTLQQLEDVSTVPGYMSNYINAAASLVHVLEGTYEPIGVRNGSFKLEDYGAYKQHLAFYLTPQALENSYNKRQAVSDKLKSLTS